MPDLLIELFSEEIPARMQSRAADDLKRLITDGLVEAGLTYASAAAFATPRRLALTVEGLPAASPDTREERKGPKVGAPDKAIDGFARGAGVARDALEIRETPKGAVYFARIETTGRPAAPIVAEILERVIRHFPWPKSMRWGSGSLRWVRPLHAITCILTDESGAQVVPLEIDGIVSGKTTRGHRFMSSGGIEPRDFDSYESLLAQAHVVLRAENRAEIIARDAQTLAFAQGLELVEDPALLSEVAGLVEWPVVLMGDIDAAFLDLPPEVLQTSMREHQKFFSVRDPKTGQIVRFVTVANIEAEDGGAAILAGNQKVLAARLADAKFFWSNDLRVAQEGMAAWATALETVTFHNKLGSQADRVARIAALAREIAPLVGADPDLAAQAAQVAKLDLASEMVYEFPELQGVMGRNYALAAQLPQAVADAARDHYAPLGPSDDVPAAPVSVAVALADKLDMLTGFWAIDEKPTGSKDPFALRRAALGVIRLVLNNALRVPLARLIDAQLLLHKITLNPDAEEALSALATEIADHGVFGAALRAISDRFGADHAVTEIGEKLPDLSADLMSFIHDRLKVHLRGEEMRHDVIDACLAMPGPDDLTLVRARAVALGDFLSTEDGENLVQGYKRANNILTQAEEKDGVSYSFGADPKLAETEAERALFAALDVTDVAPALRDEDFASVMGTLAGLRPHIDAFFDAVQINTDNAVVRRNRLNLLSQIRTLCLEVADLSRIEG